MGAVLLAELLADGSGFDLANAPSDTQRAVTQARDALVAAGYLAMAPRPPAQMGPKPQGGSGYGGTPGFAQRAVPYGDKSPNDLRSRNKNFLRK